MNVQTTDQRRSSNLTRQVHGFVRSAAKVGLTLGLVISLLAAGQYIVQLNILGVSQV